MRIGILTFHNSDNYGSVLQNYALQEYLSERYHVRTEDINFIPPNTNVVNGYFEKVSSIRKLIKNLIKASCYRSYQRRRQYFAKFRNNYIHISDKTYSEDNASTIANDYDLVICGGDQIWNTACQDFSWVYYLFHIPVNKKISYGCSMGACKFNDEDWNVIGNAITDFDAVSVREINAVNNIFKYTGIKCSNVPDPTFLLPQQSYESIARQCLIDRDFIFIYMINMDPDAMQLASDIASVSGMNAYTIISCKDSFKLKKYKNIRFVEDSSPEAFIAYIRDANVVLTNSFHGTAFSLIFNKKFYTIGSLTNDSRILTILTELNLKDRAVDSISNVHLNDDIDYQSRKEIIDRFVNTGKHYLDKVFCDEYSM